MSQGAQIPPYPQQVQQYAQQQPKKRTGAIVAIVIAVAVVAIAAIVAVGVFFSGGSGNGVFEAHYGEGIRIVVGRDTAIVPYDEDGNPMASYSASVIPQGASSGNDSGRIFEVQGTNGFKLEDSSVYLPSGAYSLSITDNTGESKSYQCPNVEITDASDHPARVNLTVGEAAPSGVVYSSAIVNQPVSFTLLSSSGDKQVSETWTYPQFSARLDGRDYSSDALINLNVAIENDIQGEISDARKWDPSKGGMQCIDVQSKVVVINHDTASVRTQKYLTNWDGMEEELVTGTVYDLSVGKAISQTSLANMSAVELSKATEEAVGAYFRSKTGRNPLTQEDKGTLDSFSSSSERYYMAPEGLVVIVRPDDLSVLGTEGIEVVVVPKRDDSPVGTDVKHKYAD